jgi:hypothetical protein
MSERTNVKVVGVFVPAGDGSLNSLENPSARDNGPKLHGKARLLSAVSNAGPCLSIDGGATDTYLVGISFM